MRKRVQSVHASRTLSGNRSALSRAVRLPAALPQFFDDPPASALHRLGQRLPLVLDRLLVLGDGFSAAAAHGCAPAQLVGDEFLGERQEAGGSKGHRPTGPGTAMLGEAIKTVSGDVPVQRIFGHTGWRQVDGEWVYLHARGGSVRTAR